MQHLLKQCRYYKGEKDCPESIEKAWKGSFWFYESVWVKRDGGKYEDEDYNIYGLSDFATNDTTPLSLKQILFNRFLYWSYTSVGIAEAFKEWYLKYYMGNNVPDLAPGITRL